MPTPPTLDDVIGKAKTEAVDRPRDRALTKSSGAELPQKGVIFVLGVPGHQRAGYDQAQAQDLFDRSMKYARNESIAWQNRYNLDYEPYEIHVFNSLSELIRKRPNASAGGLWYNVIIVTHAQGEQEEAELNSIFFGDRDYGEFDLQEFAASHGKQIAPFRQAFWTDSPLRVIGCAPGSHNSDLAIYLRELLGTAGEVQIPKIDVAITNRGFLGTPVPGAKDEKNTRAVRDDEWRKIDAIPKANRPD